MPPVNKISETLAFIVWKVELHGKVIVLQSHFRHTSFRLVVKNKGQNGEKQCATKQKETEEQLPKQNNKAALLMDTTSQIENI